MGTEYILLCEDCKIFVDLAKLHNHGDSELQDFGLDTFLCEHTDHTLRCITDNTFFNRFECPDDDFVEYRKWKLYDSPWSKRNPWLFLYEHPITAEQTKKED